jgi:hypothetical protein
MRLAMYCHKNIPPTGLRWIKASPINGEAAIELARTRQDDEVRHYGTAPASMTGLPSKAPMLSKGAGPGRAAIDL